MKGQKMGSGNVVKKCRFSGAPDGNFLLHAPDPIDVRTKA